MKIGVILMSRRFLKQHRGLDGHIKEQLAKTIVRFRENSVHPSLRLHKLSGKFEGHYSISVTEQYRVIFKPLENNDILLVSVGTHAIYK